jgi:formamidopyrimidine-DNA glycosylase
MPELPEVETVRRRLAPVLEGRRFERVEIADPRVTRPLDPLEVARELEGERVQTVDRRGKYLVVRFESGRALLIHLRMTGSLRHAPGGELGVGEGGVVNLGDDPYRRAVVTLDDGSDVAYRDVRRFGTWLLLEPSDVDMYIDERVGREPLDDAYRAKHLAERLEHRRAPIKAALLDQRTVAGVGNIYADEALWRAKVHPLTPANELTADEVKAVYRAVRESLRAGVRRQGSTLRDYQLPDGSSGRAQERFKVYGREGRPCERCGTPIDKIRAAGRGTWYCPNCQRLRH